MVTGGEGLVGSALRDIYPDLVYVTRSNADLTSFHETSKLFESIEPTHVIHLAAKVGGIGGNLQHSGEYFRENILINTNVFESARLVGVQKLVSFMSTCIFPNDATYPLTSDQLHLGAPHPSNFAYAYAKRMLDVQSKAYRAQWGIDSVIGIPTNVYGPNDNWSLTEGHVVPALIHKTYLAKERGEDLEIWGTGKPLREFVYSHDVARFSMWLLENYSSEIPLIFSSGAETSIHKLATIIAATMNFEGDIKFNTEQPDGQFRKPSEVETWKTLAPDFKFTELEVGIATTVDWFIRKYPNVRL